MKQLAISLFIAGCFCSNVMYSQCDTTVVNGDMIISSSTFLSGVYQVSGTFEIESGVTVFVEKYELGSCGKLEVQAQNIIVSGTINGDFSGYTGGIGGAPGTTVTSLTGDQIAINDCSNKDNTGQVTVEGGQAGNSGNGPGAGASGADGSNGSGPKQQCLNNDDEAGMIGGSGGAGAGGGGSYGGTGSTGAQGGAGTGSYQTNGLNVSTGFPVVGGNGGNGGNAGVAYGSISGEDIDLGSGGAGAGGGGRSYDVGLGGSDGGNGGGAVILIAQDSLAVTGAISANGENGISGGSGGNGGTSPKCCSDGCNDCGEATLSTGAGGGSGSGGGSGGGIFLQSENVAEITGNLSVSGGNGGNGGLRGNGVSCDYSDFFCGDQTLTSGNGNPGGNGGAGGGGRIKIFVPICSLSTVQPSNNLNGGTGNAAGNLGTYFLGCSELSLSEQEIELSVAIFPNPAKDMLHITSPSNASVTVLITDMSGRELFSSSAELSATPFSVAITDFQQGSYYVIIQRDGSAITKKFIKL
ncbi:MAG: T9SS type A sorting domain-containing protein [Fluviicola sp.]|nr:T9SS type A sorting domain-containing protein [Fluviicola sp.]